MTLVPDQYRWDQGKTENNLEEKKKQMNSCLALKGGIWNETAVGGSPFDNRFILPMIDKQWNNW